MSASSSALTAGGIPERWRTAVIAEMRRVVDRYPLTVLEPARYHLGWQDADGHPTEVRTGKMLRPALTLIACELWSGAWEPALPAAAAVELLHNFSLIHDDVEDASPERHHRSTVWQLIGIPRAINAGDALFTAARLALGGLRESGAAPEQVLAAFGRFDEASLHLCEGQELDLSFETRLDITVNQYETMVAGKTGALMGLSLELGALVAGAPETECAAFRRFGSSLGIAFQMRDDLLGVWGESSTTGKQADDLLNRKRGLPLVVAMHQLTGDLGHELRRLLSRSEWDGEAALALRDLLEAGGIRERCEAIVEDRSRTLHAELDALIASCPPSERLRDLSQLVKFVTGRDR